MALCLFANPLIIEKIVVPTLGSLDMSCINAKIVSSWTKQYSSFSIKRMHSCFDKPLLLKYNQSAIRHL